MTPVVFRRLAERDVREARRSYSREDRSLGANFGLEIRRAVQRIRETPRQYPEVQEGVRRALLHRFPYAKRIREAALLSYLSHG